LEKEVKGLNKKINEMEEKERDKKDVQMQTPKI
jgi:hypothetical protein